MKAFIKFTHMLTIMLVVFFIAKPQSIQAQGPLSEGIPQDQVQPPPQCMVDGPNCHEPVIRPVIPIDGVPVLPDKCVDDGCPESSPLYQYPSNNHTKLFLCKVDGPNCQIPALWSFLLGVVDPSTLKPDECQADGCPDQGQDTGDDGDGDGDDDDGDDGDGDGDNDDGDDGDGDDGDDGDDDDGDDDDGDDNDGDDNDGDDDTGDDDDGDDDDGDNDDGDDDDGDDDDGDDDGCNVNDNGVNDSNCGGITSDSNSHSCDANGDGVNDSSCNGGNGSQKSWEKVCEGVKSMGCMPLCIGAATACGRAAKGVWGAVGCAVTGYGCTLVCKNTDCSRFKAPNKP
jgi:hypothetical protein